MIKLINKGVYYSNGKLVKASSGDLSSRKKTMAYKIISAHNQSNNDQKLSIKFDEINAQIDHLCTLTFTDEELDYLKSLRFIKSDYVEFLRLWRPLRRYVRCQCFMS